MPTYTEDSNSIDSLDKGNYAILDRGLNPFQQDLLLWQLSDSALPTGGFVASSGLEAACQSGFVKDILTFEEFLRSSLHNFAYSTIPYTIEAHNIITVLLSDSVDQIQGNQERVNECVKKLAKLDRLYNTSTLNIIVKRASKAQGMAYLMLYGKSFEEFSSQLGYRHVYVSQAISEYKLLLRRAKGAGHLPISFGLILGGLGISLEHTIKQYLYQFLRTMISSGVRLNIFGPYQGQEISCKFYSLIHQLSISQDLITLTPEYAHQSVPQLDIIQNFHDNLYSRIFNS